MAENYKHLYEQMKKLVEKYQDEIVPGLREQFEKRVEVVRCKDCVHQKEHHNGRFCDVWCMFNGMGDEGFCNYGERKDNDL
jgi:hypothetical protein